jgi:L-alanine-DL-glutamate epimerase-like enolase superfamily enzyme
MCVLGRYDPWWIEEPTSPDDILGHARIRREVAPIRVAIGYSVEMRASSLDRFEFPAGSAWCEPDSIADVAGGSGSS